METQDLGCQFTAALSAGHSNVQPSRFGLDVSISFSYTEVLRLRGQAE